MKEDKLLDQKALKQVVQDLVKLVGILVDEGTFFCPKTEKLLRNIKRTVEEL